MSTRAPRLARAGGAPAARTASRRPPLTIARGAKGWVLHDPALARLAGFDAVPLPFTPEATPDEVLAHLRRLNPHREVHLASQSQRACPRAVPAPIGAKSPVP